MMLRLYLRALLEWLRRPNSRFPSLHSIRKRYLYSNLYQYRLPCRCAQDRDGTPTLCVCRGTDGRQAMRRPELLAILSRKLRPRLPWKSLPNQGANQNRNTR